MKLPKECTVFNIEVIYRELSESLSDARFDGQLLQLHSEDVLRLDVSFLQCIKALEKQKIRVLLCSPSNAVLSFCRLYRYQHLLEIQQENR